MSVPASVVFASESEAPASTRSDPQTSVALVIELAPPDSAMLAPAVIPAQSPPPVIVNRPAMVPPSVTRRVPLVMRNTVSQVRVRTVRSPAMLVYTTSGNAAPIVTVSVSPGMPSGLQLFASCQFAVPAPPSQVFSAADVEEPTPKSAAAKTHARTNPRDHRGETPSLLRLRAPARGASPDEGNRPKRRKRRVGRLEGQSIEQRDAVVMRAPFKP